MGNLGQKIRISRLQKRISLNAYAQQLGVSPAYLSNLETGKTDTIQINILDQLIKDLNLAYSPVDNIKVQNEFEIRIERAHHLLKQLHAVSPDTASFLLSMVEQSIEFFTKDSH